MAAISSIDPSHSHLPLRPSEHNERPLGQSVYDETIKQMKQGDLTVQEGARIITDRLKERARDFVHTPSRDLARQLRIGMQALKTLHQQHFYSKGSDKEHELEQSLIDTCRTVATSLASNEKYKEPEVNAQCGSLKEAYEQIKKLKGPIPKEVVQRLVPMALAAGDNEVLLVLAEKGASMRELPDERKLILAKLAIDHLQDAALQQLIEDDCPLKDKDGNSSLFLNAVSSNLINSVTSMLSSGVNIHSKDREGNTALHRAYLVRNGEMIRLLQKFINPNEKNGKGFTPLQALIHRYSQQQSEGKNLFSFLQQVLSRPKEAYQGVFVASDGVKQHLRRINKNALLPPPGDLIEIAFLLEDHALTSALFASISREEFSLSCKELRSRYPKKAVDSFYSSQFILDERHFALGCHFFDLPKEDPPSNPPVENLFMLFDSINFYNPEKEYFTDPIAFLKQAREMPPDVKTAEIARLLLRADLDEYIQKVVSRAHFVGAPIEGTPGFTVFFDQHIRMVKYIIAHLEKSKDPVEVMETIHELISSSNHCGGRYYLATLRVYMHLCGGESVKTTEEAIYLHLAKLRQMCFEAIVSKIPNREPHEYLDVLHNLGETFGIPGYTEVQNVPDPYSREHTHDGHIEKEFLEKYTPETIVNELLDTISYDDEFENFILAYLKTHGAPEWDKDHYTSILKALEATESIEDKELKEALQMSILEQHHIMKGEKESSREAVLAEQMHEYEVHCIYDEQAHMRVEAMVFILEQLGILHSSLKKTHVQPLLPLPPSNKTQEILPSPHQVANRVEENLSSLQSACKGQKIEDLPAIPDELKTAEFLF